MPKRAIRGKRGKQLYLNNMFNRGMLYTSSEMNEGFVKAISNYDINPTGDAATPRPPFALVKGTGNVSLGKYTYPIKFQQANGHQHYIEFTNVISKDYFLNDTFRDDVIPESQCIRMYSRNDDVMTTIGYEECMDAENNYISPPQVDITPRQVVDIDRSNDVAEPFFTYDYDEYAAPGYEYEYYITDNDVTKEKFKSISIPNYLIEEPDISYTDYSVRDGDTIVIDGTAYRLLGINCPEKDQEWYWFGHSITTLLLNNATNIKLIQDGQDEDDYGRKLRWVMLSFNNGLQYYLLNEVMVLLGLAKVNYVYANYKYTNRLIESQTYARSVSTKIWSDIETDPTYAYMLNEVFSSRIRGALDLELSDEMFIEAVKIEDSKRITFDLTNVIDQVEFQYLDYLDAIAFIGRVVVNNQIRYKGIILMKCVMAEGGPTFYLEIAENNGDGYKPSIIEAMSTGYNLYNHDLINTENTKQEYSPISILGIVPTNSSNDEEIVVKATPGSQVRLHGIINEGFFTEPSKIVIGNFDYVMSLDVHHIVQCNVDYGYGTILEEVYDITQEVTDVTLTKDNTNVIIKKYSESYQHKLADELIARTTGASYTFTILDYYLEINSTLAITKPSKHTYNFDNLSLSTWKELVNLDNLIYLGIKKETDALGTAYILNILDNTNDLNKVFDTNGNYVPRTAANLLPNRVFLSKWEKSSREDWIVLRDFYSNYGVTNGNFGLLNGTTNYIDYDIIDNQSISIRYSLCPAFLLSDGTPVYNEFQVMTQVLPALNIGPEWRVISNEDLVENINIRNATRIGIFNRQLFLYGSTKANIIQFSMFEKPWYFPFPFFNINIDEKIIHIHPHKDSLVIFGQYSIYMLQGGVSALELTLTKIYENLSIQSTDINTVKSIGNNIMFFNKQVGYVIVPNKYSNKPEDIAVYKLTQNVSNLLISPQKFIQDRYFLSENTILWHTYAKFNTYVENNIINVVVSYSTGYDDETPTPINHIINYRYNQTDKHWSLYDTKIFGEITASYICEPQLGYQFMVRNSGVSYLGIMIDHDLPLVYEGAALDLGMEIAPIETYIDSGFLGVDPMNDKRYKDLLLEFNNISGANLALYCNFYVDGSPILLSEAIAEDVVDTIIVEDVKRLPTTMTFGEGYGFFLDDSTFNASRVRVRFPLFGKGRMPSFTLSIRADDAYEFLNFSLIYKEKDIERR